MATDVGQGDSETPTLTITPADGTTAAALTVTPVEADGTAGTPYPVAVTGGPIADSTQTWTADVPVVYDQPGRWLLTWTVAGVGEGVEAQEVYVVASPTAGGPTWLPGRSRVANYIPNRTLARSPGTYTASGDTYALTWDSTTRPSGIQVDRLIADGAAWVTGAAGTIAAARRDLAATVVSLWVAAAIERSWPDDDSSLNRARDLQALAEGMRSDLVAAEAADTDDDSTVDALRLPVWSFPPAVSWGDSYL